MLSPPEATGSAADEFSESEDSVNNSFQGGYSKLAPSLYFCNTSRKNIFSVSGKTTKKCDKYVFSLKKNRKRLTKKRKLIKKKSYKYNKF